MKLVRKIPTVVVAVAHPGVLDADEIVTRHFAGWTHPLFTACFVGVIMAVVVTIALKIQGDATGVMTLEHVFTNTFGGTIFFIGIIPTIIVVVALPS